MLLTFYSGIHNLLGCLDICIFAVIIIENGMNVLIHLNICLSTGETNSNIQPLWYGEWSRNFPANERYPVIYN